jgi:hypothetical protein
MPYVWLNQVGENGGTVDSGDNDSGESLYQGNKLLLRGVYNGERVEIYVTGTDSATTEEPGLIKIIRTNVSDGSILSSVNISNVQGVRIRNYENGELSNKTTVLNGVEINKYSSGSLISTNYLIEGEVRLEKDGGSFSAYIDGSGNSYIDTSTGTITICGTEIGV